MEEEYKKKFRDNWKELVMSLTMNRKEISITDAYHIVKMCTKCDMNISDFLFWGIGNCGWEVEEI